MAKQLNSIVLLNVFFKILIAKSGPTEESQDDPTALNISNGTKSIYVNIAQIKHRTSDGLPLAETVWKSGSDVPGKWPDGGGFGDDFIKNILPFPRRTRGRLLRMPQAFGKRTDNMDSDRIFDEYSDNKNRSPQSITPQLTDFSNSRNPNDLTDWLRPEGYTKRLGHEVDLSGRINRQFARNRKGKLGRMPMAFGKRSKREAEVIEATLADFTPVLADNVQSYFRPENKGKDSFHSSMNDKTEVSAGPVSGHESEATSEMSENENSQGYSRLRFDFPSPVENSHAKTSPIFDRKCQNTNSELEDRDPLNVYKLGDQNLFENSQDLTKDNDIFALFTRTGRGSLARMPLAFGKRQSDNSFEDPDTRSTLDRFSRGSLGRMPLAFGKRIRENADHEYTADEIFQRNMKGQLERMPTSFVMRNDAKDYQALLELLKSKITSLEPGDDRDVLDQKLERLVEQLMSEGSKLTRPPRSKLERMPLTFGKRDHVPNSALGNLVNGHKIITRSKLDRMPLTYGRRGSESFPLPGQFNSHGISIAGVSRGDETKHHTVLADLAPGYGATHARPRTRLS